MKIFLDTNMLIDYFAQREPFYASAHKVLLIGSFEEYQMWTGAAQITDVFYILTSAKLDERLKPEQAKNELVKLRKHVNICPLTQSDVDDALASSWTDFEDACVHQCARKIRADAIITRNKKDFEKSIVPVFDCDEWLDHLGKTKGIKYDEILL